MKWSHVKHQCLPPLWSSFTQPPSEHNMFLWLWINNVVGSYNIDRDKLSTDCWDNKAILRLLCGLWGCLWSLCYVWGGKSLNGFPSVNYTLPPLGWVHVATVHKSSCHGASCSHVSHKVVPWNLLLRLIRCGLGKGKITRGGSCFVCVIDVGERMFSPVKCTRKGPVQLSE